MPESLQWVSRRRDEQQFRLALRALHEAADERNEARRHGAGSCRLFQVGQAVSALVSFPASINVRTTLASTFATSRGRPMPCRISARSTATTAASVSISYEVNSLIHIRRR